MKFRHISLVTLSLFWSSTLLAQTRPTTVPDAAKQKDLYRAHALTHSSDAARGRLIFENAEKVGCIRCHTTDGKGGKVGPDLLAAGDKFTRFELADAILYPSKSIAVGFAATVVTTVAGDVVEGVVKDATGDALTLMTADAKLVRIPTADIRKQRASDVSIMPEGLETAMTLPQFGDLLEYLVSLKLPESQATNVRGMPRVIEELSPAITLTPYTTPATKFQHPVWFGFVPGGGGASVVLEHESGKAWTLAAGGASRSLFLQTAGKDKGAEGLLGIAFHPKFATNHRYFIIKHLADGNRFGDTVFEGEAATNGLADSGKPLKKILHWDGVTNNHNGGCLAFGPDGFLYLGTGDTGPQNDPQGHAQDLSLITGKMLRIDVDHADAGRAYAVPADNPFVGNAAARPEIWAVGFRNPWRFSFDPLTADLWVGDVGQDLYEEYDLVRRGDNLGWNAYEGFERFSTRYRKEGAAYVPPVFAYSHRVGASATGGYVYRADPKNRFYGAYICGDYNTKRIWAVTQEAGTLKTVRQLCVAPEPVVSFGLDAKGEIYVVGYDGTIFHLDLK